MKRGSTKVWIWSGSVLRPNMSSCVRSELTYSRSWQTLREEELLLQHVDGILCDSSFPPSPSPGLLALWLEVILPSSKIVFQTTSSLVLIGYAIAKIAAAAPCSAG
mmetsp:Transcript_9196/g.20495  ORF Transcript_9196/g.20495 Transcript_9196/m.20495 type:complete len:106 (+) Transcript_9196:1029-1346(+)